MQKEQERYVYALPPGTVLSNGKQPYTVVRVLGQGGFGITYEVKAELMVGQVSVDVSFALKEFFMKGRCHRAPDGIAVATSHEAADDVNDCMADFLKEGRLLAHICKGSANVVNVNEVFEENNTAYYVMEYLDGGDLRHFVRAHGGCLSEAQAMAIMQPVAQALTYLHRNNLLHMDVKPENIVMRKGKNGRPDTPVLIDFGVSLHFDKKGNLTTTHITSGTSRGYSPIEQYSPVKQFEPTYDVYALAATWLYLLTGRDPVDAFNLTPDYVERQLPPEVSQLTRRALTHGMAMLKQQRTPSVTAFMEEFEPRVTLPLGFVLNSPCGSFVIVSVVATDYDAIRYRCKPYNPHATEGVATETGNYLLIEYFVRGQHRRAADERVVGAVVPDESFMQMAATKTKLTQLGSTDRASGLLNAALFAANGTTYVLWREGWRPARDPSPLTIAWLKMMASMKKNAKKWALALLFVAALVAAVIFVPRFFSGSNSTATAPSHEDSLRIKEQEVAEAAEELRQQMDTQDNQQADTNSQQLNPSAVKSVTTTVDSRAAIQAVSQDNKKQQGVPTSSSAAPSQPGMTSQPSNPSRASGSSKPKVDQQKVNDLFDPDVNKQTVDDLFK